MEREKWIQTCEELWAASAAGAVPVGFSFGGECLFAENTVEESEGKVQDASQKVRKTLRKMPRTTLRQTRGFAFFFD